MVHVVAPDVERVRDAFGAEDVGEFAAAFGRFVCALSGEDDDGVGVAQAREEVVVVEVRQVRDRVVEVDVVVVIAVEPLSHVVAAAHRERAAQNVRVAEVGVGCEVRAQACARGERGLAVRLVAYERQHLVGDVAVVAREQLGLDPRRGLLVHQAVAVDAIDGVGAKPPRLDVILDGVNQVEPLVFEEVRGGGREHQERVARVAVGHNRHLHPQVRAVPGLNATLHT